jgi:hypothetical protein
VSMKPRAKPSPRRNGNQKLPELAGFRATIAELPAYGTTSPASQDHAAS